MQGWILQNTLVAGVLALLALAGWRLWRKRPAVGHVMWLLVLAVLMAPPLPVAPWRGPRDRAADLTELALSHARPLVVVPARREKIQTPQRRIPREPTPRGLYDDVDFGSPLVAAPAADRARDICANESGGSPREALLTLWNVARRAGAEAASRPDDSVWLDADLAETFEAAPSLALAETPAANEAEIVASPAADVEPARAEVPFVSAWLGEAWPRIWLVGSLVAAVVLLRRVRRFDASLRIRREESDEALCGIVSLAARRFQVNAPEVWMVRGAPTPMIWAFGRPKLIWPAEDIAPGLSMGDRAIIAHELAHLRRRDHWIAWFEIVAIVLLWWHPLAYFARRRMRMYAELAADAWVVWALPQQRRAYADALLETAARAPLARPALASLGVVDSRKRAFHRRLRMIMSAKTSRRMQPLAAAAAITLIAGLLPTWSGASGAERAAEERATLAFELDIDARILPHLRAMRLQAEAERALMSDNVDRAAELYEQYLELRADDSDAWEHLGRMYYDHDNWAGAYRGWSRAAELDPQDAKSAYNAACAAALQGKTDVAMTWLERSLRGGFELENYIEDDSDLDSLRDAGRLDEFMKQVDALSAAREAAQEAENDDDWSAAADAWATVAKLTPKCAGAAEQHAMALYHAKRWNEAEAAFRRQADLTDDSDALYNRACSLALAGENSRALDALEEAFAGGYSGFSHVRMDDDFKNLRGNTRFDEMVKKASRAERLRREAQVASEFADYAGAVSRYREALDARPSESVRKWITHELALAELRSGDYQSAADHFRDQAAAGEDLKNSLYNVACAYAMAGDREPALSYLAATLEAGWNDARHMLTDDDLANLRGREDFRRLVLNAADNELLGVVGAADWDQAEADGEAMVEEDPNSGQGHLRIGLARMRKGDYDAALKHFQAHLKSGWTPHVAHYNLACAYAYMGRKDRAFAELEEAAKAGFADADHYRYDLDLQDLFDDPRFKAFLERVEHGEYHKHDGDKHNTAALAPAGHSHGGHASANVESAEAPAAIAGGGSAPSKPAAIVAPKAPTSPRRAGGGG